MRIVQTFCAFNQPVLRTKFGWYSSYYHACSWALSCHTLRMYYNDVTLYADVNGVDLLIDKLNLPYTSVVKYNDDLHKYNKASWALAKMKTFAMQQSPFLHVDGDVFIGKPFCESLLHSPIIAQNLEIASKLYVKNLNGAKDHLRYLPAIMHADIKQDDMCSFNAGIIGGHDLDMFHELAQLAFAIAEKNEISKLPANVLLNLNVLLEQVMLYRLLQQQGRHAACLYDEPFFDFGYTVRDVANLDGISEGKGYVHLVGGHKRMRTICEKMEKNLWERFPDAHAAVAKLYKKN